MNAEENPSDWIRDAVADAFAAQDMTAYALSQKLGGKPTKETIQRYVTKKIHLQTQHVCRICEGLGIQGVSFTKKRRTKKSGT